MKLKKPEKILSKPLEEDGNAGFEEIKSGYTVGTDIDDQAR